MLRRLALVGALALSTAAAGRQAGTCDGASSDSTIVFAATTLVTIAGMMPVSGEPGSSDGITIISSNTPKVHVCSDGIVVVRALLDVPNWANLAVGDTVWLHVDTGAKVSDAGRDSATTRSTTRLIHVPGFPDESGETAIYRATVHNGRLCFSARLSDADSLQWIKR